jgi:hypothetical protein
MKKYNASPLQTPVSQSWLENNQCLVPESYKTHDKFCRKNNDILIIKAGGT